MAGDEYSLTGQGIRRLKEMSRIVGGGKTSNRPPPRRRRNRGDSKRLFVRIKGLATSAVDENDSTFDIDNIEVCIGSDPRSDTESSSETVTLKNDPPIVCDDNAVVYAVYDLSESSQDWTTADAGNFLAMLKGIGSYDDTAKQAIMMDADDDPEWVDLQVEQVVEDYDHANTEFDTKDVTVFESGNTGTTNIPTDTCT